MPVFMDYWKVVINKDNKNCPYKKDGTENRVRCGLKDSVTATITWCNVQNCPFRVNR
jgi:hypothetical protein